MTAENVKAPLIDPSLKIIADLEKSNERLRAEVAYIKAPDATNFQIMKNAVTDTGIPRTTLQNWIEAKPSKVKCITDEHGVVWIDCIDASRVRWALAPSETTKIQVGQDLKTAKA